jgi:RNA polymerase sigma factor (sigma-70 family)
MDDNSHLRQFVEAGSQESFRELVGRHTNLVYACAMQRLRDPHAAEDVTQAVFLTLALKAKNLRSHTSLAGWLFTTTRYVATRYQRGEQRRKEREMRAFEETPIADSGTATEAAWEHMQPHLAGALDSLSGADREAVLLRFYRKASHREVAAALGTSEDGARMRVDRALDKLRRFFAKKSVALSATALAGALTANAAQAAPAGLAATAGATALAGAGGTLTVTSTIVLAKGAIQMMFIAQLKTAALITAACVVVAGSGVIVAKEVLVPPVAPVSAQAEQKSPQPATATNDTATIAWGEAVNGLRAGLLPAGGGASMRWDYEFGMCRNCQALSRKTTAQIKASVFGKCPECGSARTYAGWLCFDCAQAQRVCLGCRKPRPSGATFVEGEPIFLELYVKNVGSEKRNAAPPFLNETMGWYPVFQPTGGGDDLLWRRRPGAVLRRGIPALIPLEPQKEHVWVTVLNDDVGFAFQAASGTESKTFQQLPPGKYRVIMKCASDKLATGPVEIEIVPAVRVSHKLTGEGRNTRLSVTVTNPGTTPLELNKNVSTDAIRALRFFDADGKRVPTLPPPLPTEGTITVAPGESREFDYGLNIFSPPLKAGHYSIHVSFISADPIQWTIPEQGAEGDAVKQPGLESKATVKDGLQVVVRLDKALYAPNEPLTFTVIYTNVREKGNAFCLWDAGYFKDWKIMAGDWEVAGWPESERSVDGAFLKTLGAGEQVEAPVKIGGDGAAHFFSTRQRKPVPPRRFLPPGKYPLRLTIPLREAPLTLRRALPRWIGEISTEPVEFEVGGPAAAR